MNILVIAEKRKKAQPFIDAIRQRKAHAKYLRVSKITLVSVQNKTTLKALGKELPLYDAVFIQTRLSLAPFIEPLLEELYNQKSYVNVKKGSYYLGLNEPYQFVTLALAGVPAPRTLTTGSPKNIEKVSTKISYPLLAKSFIGKKAQQAIMINSTHALNSFVKSIKTEIDGLMLREFVEGDVVTCAVVGKKVFAIKRKFSDGNVLEIHEGAMYKPTETEERTALAAADACGYDIARIDLSKGLVVKAEPTIPLEEFNKICSENLEENIANFLIEKAEAHEHKTNITYGIFGTIKRIILAIFGRLFK